MYFDATDVTDILVLQTNYHLNSSRPAVISISSCQRNLMKTYHNEANTSGITKIASKKFFGAFRTKELDLEKSLFCNLLSVINYF